MVPGEVKILFPSHWEQIYSYWTEYRSRFILLIKNNSKLQKHLWKSMSIWQITNTCHVPSRLLNSRRRNVAPVIEFTIPSEGEEKKSKKDYIYLLLSCPTKYLTRKPFTLNPDNWENLFIERLVILFPFVIFLLFRIKMQKDLWSVTYRFGYLWVVIFSLLPTKPPFHPPLTFP